MREASAELLERTSISSPKSVIVVVVVVVQDVLITQCERSFWIFREESKRGQGFVVDV